MLLDLGPHLADQALVLFGKPEAVSADVLREKDGPGVNDAFTIRLRYPGLMVTLGANSSFAARRAALSSARNQGRLHEIRRRPAGGRAEQNHANRRIPPGARSHCFVGRAACGHRRRRSQPSRSRASPAITGSTMRAFAMRCWERLPRP